MTWKQPAGETEGHSEVALVVNCAIERGSHLPTSEKRRLCLSIIPRILLPCYVDRTATAKHWRASWWVSLRPWSGARPLAQEQRTCR